MSLRKVLCVLLFAMLASLSGMATETITHAKFLGIRTLNPGAQSQAAVSNPRLMPKPPKPFFGLNPNAAVPSPTLVGVPVVGPGSGFHGFTGITAATAADVQGFTNEPPDQGLGVSDTEVVETVNLSVQAFTRDGGNLAGPVSFYDFLQLDPNTIFLSDPRVFFDHDTQRWFITILQFALDASGNFAPPAYTLVAVSAQTSAIGEYYLFAFEVTDKRHRGCPCFGDQPLVGFNKNGIFLSMNEYTFDTETFETVLLMATDKYALASGHAHPVVALQNLSGGGMPGFSVQPSVHARGTPTSMEHGTEFLLSTLNPEGFSDNRLQLWALTNTRSLASNSPVLKLTTHTIVTEPYIQTNVVPQKKGPTPLRDALNDQFQNDDPLESLDPGDLRMQQVMFAGGKLYAAMSTLLLKPSGGSRNGVAWFVIDPGLSANSLTAIVPAQGYLAAKNIYLLYPAIAVNSEGEGVIGFSMSSTRIFPSIGYSKFLRTQTENEIHLAFPGAAPEDGFSGYFEFGGNGTARWGDYSAATIAPDNSFWFAGEYIPNLQRTFYTNWGTAIGSIDVQSRDQR
jgi:hypothetical protein